MASCKERKSSKLGIWLINGVKIESGRVAVWWRVFCKASRQAGGASGLFGGSAGLDSNGHQPVAGRWAANIGRLSSGAHGGIS